MKNDFYFWEEYLKRLKQEIQKLCNEKPFFYADFHIHSNCSSDGKQTVQEILDTTREVGLDLIAITDHDTVRVYDELFERLKNGFTKPLVIPGIEFTMDNRDYGSQCHLLQLFINPKNPIFLKDVKRSEEANFQRSKIQLKRLNENLAILELKKKYSFTYSYRGYLSYLEKNHMVPEYDTLCSYLMEKFIKKKITTFEVLSLLEKYNEQDIYLDRREYKRKRFHVLREKYERDCKNDFNTRFLLSMLAVREVDDDWWDSPSSGSLSVNSYGQLTISEINDLYPIYFAHPTENKLELVKQLVKEYPKIIGVEENIRNIYQDPLNFRKFFDMGKINRITGSDSHDATFRFYQDMEFYRLSKEEVEKIL